MNHRIKVADCTPAMMAAAGAVHSSHLPDYDHPDGETRYWSSDGRELHDGDAVSVPAAALEGAAS